MFWIPLICKTDAGDISKYKNEHSPLPQIYSLVRDGQVYCGQLCHVLGGCTSGIFFYFDKVNYFEEVCFACVTIWRHAICVKGNAFMSQVGLYNHYDANYYNKVLHNTIKLMIK